MNQTAMTQKELNKFLGILPIQDPYKLKTLSTRHKQVILLHLEGLPPKQISDELGISPGQISRILRSDSAQALIDNYLSFADQEFKVLYGLSINAVREALTCNDIKVKLDAAKVYLKAHGKDGDKGNLSGGETAEDVVRRVIEMQVRILEERGPLEETPKLSLKIEREVEPLALKEKS